MSGFMGPYKLSSLVTTLSNHPPCFKVIMWRENEVAQDDGRAGRSLRTKFSSQEQRTNFDLVETLRKVVVRENREATHTTCWSSSSLQWVYRFESSRHSRIWVTACSLMPSCSMSCYIDGWFRVLWLWLSWLLLYYFNNVVNYLVDAFSMHVIV
jgi:hypothetical protein